MKNNGGDTIKPKTFYIGFFVICLAIGGLLFSGTINSQNVSKENENSLIQPAAATTSGQTVNAKSNHQKRSSIITTRGECSCSLCTSGATFTKSWQNYCPECGKYGTLTYQRTWDSPEGLIWCKSCDADYCAVHGKEHIGYGAKYLRSA
ncbi:MAG: hypothetical protein ACXVHN_01970 [Methanobacterium sp.]